MKTILRSFISLTAVAWTCGCGSDAGNPNGTQTPSNSGGSGGTIDQTPATGGTSSGGSGGTKLDLEPSGGSGGTTNEPGPKMNTSNAELVVTPYDTDSAGLEVISSNLLTRPSASDWFEQWYVVVENKGSTLLCYIQVEGDFRRGGVSITHHNGFTDAPAYKVGTSTLSSSCLAPGDRGVLYTNGFADENYQPDTIDEVEITLFGQPFTGVVHPDAPTLEGSSQNWRVAGTATSNATIYNIGMDVYPYDEDGLVFDRLLAHHLDTFYEGATWNYETGAAEKDFSQYEQFVSFIEGASFFIDGPLDPDVERLNELAQKQQKQRDIRDENEKTFQSPQ